MCKGLVVHVVCLLSSLSFGTVRAALFVPVSGTLKAGTSPDVNFGAVYGGYGNNYFSGQAVLQIFAEILPDPEFLEFRIYGHSDGDIQASASGSLTFTVTASQDCQFSDYSYTYGSFDSDVTVKNLETSAIV